MKQHFFTLLSCWIFSTLTLFGQNPSSYNLKGVVRDTANGPMVNATVMLLLPADSSLSTFGRTNDEGNFDLRRAQPGAYILRITYLGYQTYNQSVELKGAQAEVILDTIRMLPQNNLLGEFTINGERNPVTIKQDTIEYNAGSFKTQPNAVVEDLLKKLPGVQVEKDGTVKAQGQTVRDVTVDGKPFFGNDPKLATKNLPADAVDKVQVFDKKSDMSTFTGIDDGSHSKSINLELKEDKKKGVFGNVMAGGGDNSRYTSKVNLNRFYKEQQLALLALGNNVNEAGFSFEDYMSFAGAAQKMMGGGGGSFTLQLDPESVGLPIDMGSNNGFLTSLASGLNYNDRWSKKTEVTSSYFFSQLKNKQDLEVHTENFLPQGSFFSQQNSTRDDNNLNHRLNFGLEHKIDSLHSLKWSNDFTYNDTKSDVTSDGQSLNGEQVLENEITRKTHSTGNSSNLNSNLLFRKKFAKKGRTFSSNLHFGLRDERRRGTLTSQSAFYNDGGEVLDSLLQNNRQRSDRYDYGATISYTEPIARKMYLEGNYNFSANLNDVDRRVYDLEAGQEVANNPLSNVYNSAYLYHRAGLNYYLNRKKYKFNTGVSYQASSLKGDLTLQDTSIHQKFGNILPSAHYSYSFSSTKNFDVSYESSVQEPSINQLQPVVDNADPLNIYIGNPGLRPEYRNELRLHFSSFDPSSMIHFFSDISGDYTADKIVDAQTIDTQFVRTSRPENVGGSYTANAYLTFGFPIKKIDGRFNINATGAWNRSQGRINTVLNSTNRWLAGGDIRFDYDPAEWFSWSVGANVSYHLTQYEVSKSNDQSYVNQRFYSNLDVEIPGGVHVATSMDYTRYVGLSDGFNQDIPIWNASVSKYLLKNNRAEIRFSVNDLLNRNTGISRHAELNFVQDERIRSLGRYFMLSFHYTLNSLGAGMKGGGMKVMIRNNEF